MCVGKSYPPVISCIVLCSDRALQGRQPRLVRMVFNRDDGNQSLRIMTFSCATYSEGWSMVYTCWLLCITMVTNCLMVGIRSDYPSVFLLVMNCVCILSP